eukprot:4591306-Prymnesium_polylepis.1
MLRTVTTRLAAAVIMTLGALFLYHVVEARVRAWRPSRKAHVPAVLLPALACVFLLLKLLQGPLYGVFYPF